MWRDLLPSDITLRLLIVLFTLVGHACIWTYLLNNLYGRKIPKKILKPWRIVTGLMILLGWPLLMMATSIVSAYQFSWSGFFNNLAIGYGYFCLFFGSIVFPLITFYRLFFRPRASSLIQEKTQSIDYRKMLGEKIYGKGHWWWMAKVPFTNVFRVEFTELTLRIPNLPKEWDNLTILHLTDLHFHGTPERVYFDEVFREIKSRWPENDIIAVTGDYLDSDSHIEWIQPLLGNLQAKEGKFAILGNHDEHHQPGAIRDALAKAGYELASNRWLQAIVRGLPLAIVGHEGPWFSPGPTEARTELTDIPKLALTHSPDRVYWLRRQNCFLTLAGHVHGGQVRLPIIGSIFVPSIYSRRFDCGLFEIDGMPMVVGRGLSGKEPLRFRCNPQVIRITIKVV